VNNAATVLFSRTSRHCTLVVLAMDKFDMKERQIEREGDDASECR